MARKDSGWWDDFFPAFRPLFDIMPSRATNAHVRYIIKKLGLRPGKKFLDCPCGIGRISIPFAKRGIRVTGVDITHSYLDELADKARRLKLKMDLVHRDMRRINFNSQFDAAGNLWTSFGYFEKDSDNLLVLKRIFRALKPGGKFMLHIINRDWIMANYQPRGWMELKDRRGKSIGKMVDERRFDYRTATSHGTYYFFKDGREIVRESHLRVYSFHELVQMMEAVGFVDTEGFGSVKDAPISYLSQMMFVIGTKPTRR
jgi:ubiquinone/menaquinone biosynthesis C-methylase UbiE